MFPHKNLYSVDSDPPDRAQMIGDNRWLSQNSFQNVDSEKIDWAALAQQWIHMKEACHTIPPDPPMIPNAPPPPRISVQIRDYEEQGEAPMEVEHDDEPIPVNLTAPPPPTNIFANAKNWTNSQNDGNRQPKQWSNKKQNRWNSTTPTRVKRGNSSDNSQTNQFRSSIKVWQAPPPPILSNTPSGSNTDNKFNDHEIKSDAAAVSIGESLGTLNASQRKTLPAWIREGLEKMEREKQRQADRDRVMKERDEKRRQEKLLEQSVLSQFEPTSLIPAKSKFESDTDSDNDDKNSDKYTNIVVPTASNIVETAIKPTTVGSSAWIEKPTMSPAKNEQRTKAEILTEIMLSVRKNLTEILLEVTSEEISAIAQETLSKIRSKGRKPQIVQKIAKTANSAALGLVLYDDSDGSRSDYDSDAVDSQKGHLDSDNDSDLELKKSIQRRKHAFETKAAEIESYLADKERQEKEWLAEDNGKETNTPLSSTKNSNNDVTSKGGLFQTPLSDSENNDFSALGTKSERKGSRFSAAKSLIYNVASSQLLQNAAVPPVKIQSIVPDAKPNIQPKSDDKNDASTGDESSISGKKSHKHSKSDKHRSKRHRSRSHSRSKKRKHASKRSRSSSSSSDDSRRHSRKSRKHSRRDRSSSDDRTSRSSHSSLKRDKYSKENSRSYRRSRSGSREKRRRH